jgi:hypothetical protein
MRSSRLEQPRANLHQLGSRSFTATSNGDGQLHACRSEAYPSAWDRGQHLGLKIYPLRVQRALACAERDFVTWKWGGRGQPCSMRSEASFAARIVPQTPQLVNSFQLDIRLSPSSSLSSLTPIAQTQHRGRPPSTLPDGHQPVDATADPPPVAPSLACLRPHGLRMQLAFITPHPLSPPLGRNARTNHHRRRSNLTRTEAGLSTHV